MTQISAVFVLGLTTVCGTDEKTSSKQLYINISLNEYTKMMNSYLQTRDNSGNSAIPKLVTFDVDVSKS
ncbi:hypothetical protein NQ317_007112 [Molorchus minor]|uniref:Uncharacterized protein n=1 Tax=Molorchus minor TaxID=1323400 RepID=A0ABQ9JYK8_9CUCU|nr:hypothetical protein NQ317_007112 [Molorchus minor]